MSAPSLFDSTAAPAKEIPPPRFRWSTRVLFPASVLAGFALIFAGSLVQSASPVQEVQATPVVERAAIKAGPQLPVGAADPPAGGVQAAGWLEPAPSATWVTALTDGTVQEVLFVEGEAVQAGQVLVRLVPDDARLSLERAAAERRAAEEAWSANVENERAVAVAKAAVRETSASLTAAVWELNAERARLREAKRRADRLRTLRASGSCSEADLDAALRDFEALTASVEKGAATIERLQATLDSQDAEVVAAQKRADLRTEERLRLEMARTRHAEAELAVGRLEVRAPSTGVVMRRLVEPGSRVRATSDDPTAAQVAQIYDPARLQLRADVPLADAARVGVGHRAEVIVEVLPQRTFRGEVTQVLHVADLQKNTLQVKVRVEDPAPELRPEMLARVRFLEPKTAPGDVPVTSGGKAVFAPAAGIAGESAWVIAKFDGREGIAQRRAVELTGAGDEEWKEVASGLRPGDLVVTSGGAGLSEGIRVRVTSKGGAN